jgi:DNA topoisomerase-1
MRYYNTVTVEPVVYTCLQKFAAGKNPTDELFDRISTSSLNDYLKSFMGGLSAKVFRTFNASVTLETELKKLETANRTDLEDKVAMYNDANR